MANETLWLADNILFIWIDDKALLIDLNNDIHYTPNESARMLLDVLVGQKEKGRGKPWKKAHFNDLIKHVTAIYNMKDPDAESAIREFLAKPPEDGGLKGFVMSGPPPATAATEEVMKFYMDKKPTMGKWESPEVATGGSGASLGSGSPLVPYRP